MSKFSRRGKFGEKIRYFAPLFLASEFYLIRGIIYATHYASKG